MIIARVRHKGLRRLYEDDDSSGLPAASVKRIKAILAALESADDLAQVATMPGWRLHPLKGGRQGQHAINITGNWRLIFAAERNVVTDLDLVDYH
jgi:proteic killer suppression protein